MSNGLNKESLPPLSFIKDILRPDIHRARSPSDIIRRRNNVEPSGYEVVVPLIIPKRRREDPAAGSRTAHHQLVRSVKCMPDGCPFNPV